MTQLAEQIYLNYINGEWVRSDTGTTFPSINPAHKNEVLGRFQKSNAEDVKAAVDAAWDAFNKWSETPAPKRAEILLRAAKIVEDRKEELGRLVTREMGKVLTEGRADVQEAIDTFKYFAGEGRRLFGHTTTSELPNKFAMFVRRPVGVFAIITPWNFPIAIPSWKMAPCLVAGNTIVFKPATDTPLCALELVRVLEKAGLPKGVVNLVTGSGDEVGLPLVKHRKVGGVSLTGSREVGEQILKEAGVKKVGLELGGKNPIIVMDDADLDLAVDGSVWGGFGSTGQRCTAASRIILHKKVKDTFMALFLDRTKKLRVGDGLNEGIDVGPVINERQLRKIHSYTEIGQREGATLRIGGRMLTEAELSDGFFYSPTVFDNVATEMRVAQEEIFGPVVSVLEASNLDEAIEMANDIEYGLSSAIYTRDIANAFRAVEKIEAGITYINSSTIGSEAHLPFGGVKHTGNGTREGGVLGIDEFTEVKTVYVDYSGKLQRAQIDVEY